MKIGIFTDTYYPQINGVVTSVRMLERELNKLGHTVFIFTTTDPGVNQSLPRVFRLPSMAFVFLPTHRFALFYPPKLLLKLKHLGLDIVHTQTEFPVGIFGRLVAELYNLPTVHTYHTMYEDYTHYVANGHLISRKTAKRYSRIFCNRASAVVAPVEKTKARLLEYGVKRPISVIPTGLALSNFSAAGHTPEELAAESDRLKAELNLSPDDPIVLFVGRIAKEKSVDVIVSAMPKLLERMPRAKLLLVGGGPVADELRAQAEALGVGGSVVFSGPKPWDGIGGYYRLGDVFVTASTSETQGLTYIEAMAAGRVVVAKKDPSVDDLIVHGETGYIFERDDELADLLYSVLSNREEAQAVADRALLNVSRMSAAKFAESVAKLYAEVIEAYVPKSRRPLAAWNKVKNGVRFIPMDRKKSSLGGAIKKILPVGGKKAGPEER